MLKIDQAVLVIVDVQGKLATLMHNRDEFYRNMIRIIRGAQTLKLPILWNEQLPDKLGPTIDEIREILTDMKPMIKETFSCCGNPEFMAGLKATGRRQVLVTGMEAHVCVYQTAQDLLAAGYEVYLVADAVSSRSESNHRLGTDSIHALGGHVTGVEMAFLEMLQVARGEAFKEIIRIIK